MLFLFAINGMVQQLTFVFDGDFSAAGLSDFHLGMAHGVGSPPGLDLIDHVVVRERQVLGQGATLTQSQHALEIFKVLIRVRAYLPVSRGFRSGEHLVQSLSIK